jgi:hypothetical protein
MVEPYKSPYAELSHTDWIPTDGVLWEMTYCDFEGGYATCPPPEFDLDAYIEQNGAPPLVIESDFNPYDYDVERDQIVVEVLP